METASRKHQLRKPYALIQCLRQAKRVNGDDPFSQLPDEIIASHILSRFTLEEGARCNILSHRWKKLWACTIGSKLIFAPEHLRTSHLTKSMNDRVGQSRASFDRPKKSMDGRVGQSRSCLHPEESIDDKIHRLRVCFERWISNVVQAYGGPKLDELTVRFPFDFSNSDSIDRWIECAFKKGITRLELDFCWWGKAFYIKTYCFPKIEKLQGMLANCGDFHNLRDVYLKRVCVRREVIEFMLAHFPLERLCIKGSHIGKLSVSEVSVRLKSLELAGCTVDLKISASSLTSLTYTGKESRLLLEYVPNLSELSVDREFCTTSLHTGFFKRGFISRLKSLEFAMPEGAVHRSIDYPLKFPETLNLEELKIDIHGEKDACFLWPILLIKAAPFLRKFSVKLHSSSRWGKSTQLNDEHLRNATRRVQRHQCLETVELHNYSGFPSELELVQHLLGVSDMLEQILVYIDSRCPPDIRSQAEAIGTRIPPSSKVKLILIVL